MQSSKAKQKLKTKVDRQAQQIARLQEENLNLKATLRIMGGDLQLTNRRERNGIEEATLALNIPLPVSDGWRFGFSDDYQIKYDIQLHRRKK